MPHETYRLGRVVEHDPASLAHPAAVGTKPKTVLWPHVGPILDQGQKSSCTGNAAAQLFNCAIYAPERIRLHGGSYLTEDDALRLYSAATRLDAFPGAYPPDDTGSSGLAVAKAARALGYVKSYKHAFGMSHLIGALQLAPTIVGTDWFESMYEPDPHGFLVPGGKLDGGHEYLILGVDLEKLFFTFLQSWGDGWGDPNDPGRFYMTFDNYAPLIRNGGDVTVLTGWA